MVKRRSKPVARATTTKDSELKIKDNHKEPRHGFTLECEYCQFKYTCGGKETIEKRDKVEQEVRKEHDKLHKETEQSGKGKLIIVEENGQFVEKVPPLKVNKSTHAVEAEHDNIVQANRQTTTTTG